MRRPGHILSSLTVFGVLSAAYSLFISSAPPTWIQGIENLWIRNTVLAERVLYGDERWDAVLVGSSMGGRLPFNSLSDKVFNFSLGANPALVGLRLIVEGGNVMPRLVLIEINALHRSENREFSDGLLEPVMFEAKKNVPMLRDSNRPLAQSAWATFHLARRVAGRTDFSMSANKRPPRAVRPKSTNPLFDELLGLEVDAHAVLPTPAETAQTRASLRELVSELRRRGVKVVFFEAPVHPKIASSPAYEHNRAIINDLFPATEFPRLASPNDEAHETTDGIHLTMESAWDYMDVMGEELRRRGFVPYRASEKLEPE